GRRDWERRLPAYATPRRLSPRPRPEWATSAKTSMPTWWHSARRWTLCEPWSIRSTAIPQLCSGVGGVVTGDPRLNEEAARRRVCGRVVGMRAVPPFRRASLLRPRDSRARAGARWSTRGLAHPGSAGAAGCGAQLQLPARPHRVACVRRRARPLRGSPLDGPPEPLRRAGAGAPALRSAPAQASGEATAGDARDGRPRLRRRRRPDPGGVRGTARVARRRPPADTAGARLRRPQPDRRPRPRVRGTRDGGRPRRLRRPGRNGGEDRAATRGLRMVGSGHVVSDARTAHVVADRRGP